MILRALAVWLLTVLPAMAQDIGSLRIVLPDTRPVVGEMIPVTIRGEYGQRMSLENLEIPSSQDYDWIQLGRDIWQQGRINGRVTQVFERRLAVFPRKPGDLTLGPFTHDLTTSARVQVKAVARPATIAVTPYPGEGRPLTASALTITDELSAEPGSLRDGESLIRKVTLTAKGALPHMLPPRPAIRELWLISFAAPETRETVPTLDGPVTTITWEWHLRPKTGEPGVLPEILIPWFDTGARRMETARMAAIPFGYASFGAGLSGDGTVPLWQVLGVVLAAMAAASLWLLSGFQALPWRRLRQMILRQLPDPTIPPLRQAEQARDLFALRRALDAHMTRRAELGRPVSSDAATALDQSIFAQNGPEPNIPAVMKALRL